MTPDTEDWFTRTASLARVWLGETGGAFLIVPSIKCERGTFSGPVFLWLDDNDLVDVLPWAEAVARFGAPRRLM